MFAWAAIKDVGGVGVDLVQINISGLLHENNPRDNSSAGSDYLVAGALHIIS